MAVIPLLSPITSAGVGNCPPLVPLPRRPVEPSPQHFTPPLVVRAQVKLEPLAMDTTAVPRPFTSTGTARSFSEPSPSSPLWLRPQHAASPVVETLQVCHVARLTSVHSQGVVWG